MTVKELRDYLYKCNDDFVVRDINGDEISIIVEHKNITENDENYVEIY